MSFLVANNPLAIPRDPQGDGLNLHSGILLCTDAADDAALQKRRPFACRTGLPLSFAKTP